MNDLFRGIFGVMGFVFIAFLFSANKRAINWRLVFIGILLQFLFGYLVIKVPFAQQFFFQVSTTFVGFLDFATVGANFIFGDLAKNSNAFPDTKHQLGLIIAFQVLPTIIFFATVTAALYYLGILQRVVFGIAWVMAKTMGLSGPESLCAAGNIFLGQTEAPLLVKPYVGSMTRSELLCLMTGGMATIAGGVMAAYVTFLGGNDPLQRAIFAAHLLSASVMSAPAAIVIAKILIPETEKNPAGQKLTLPKDNFGVNLIDAMSIGASDGIKLAINVGGMLLAFTAVIAMLNHFLGLIGTWIGMDSLVIYSSGGLFKHFSLEYILGFIGRPFAYLMGVEWKETMLVGSLVGQKTAINEFVAYLNLADMKARGILSEKSIVISTYALCGFSNFASIAIQIAGIGGLFPNQPELQSRLSQLGLKALLGASLACFMTAAIAGAIG